MRKAIRIMEKVLYCRPMAVNKMVASLNKLHERYAPARSLYLCCLQGMSQSNNNYLFGKH